MVHFPFGPRDQLLKHVSPFPERLRPPILPVERQHVKRHVDGLGRAGPRGSPTIDVTARQAGALAPLVRIVPDQPERGSVTTRTGVRRTAPVHADRHSSPVELLTSHPRQEIRFLLVLTSLLAVMLVVLLQPAPARSQPTVPNPLCPGKDAFFNPGRGEDIVLDSHFSVSVFCERSELPI